jgi:hypothetical protein
MATDSHLLIVSRALFQVFIAMASKESLELLTDKHVQYIKGLNAVNGPTVILSKLCRNRTNSNIG